MTIKFSFSTLRETERCLFQVWIFLIKNSSYTDQFNEKSEIESFVVIEDPEIEPECSERIEEERERGGGGSGGKQIEQQQNTGVRQAKSLISLDSTFNYPPTQYRYCDVRLPPPPPPSPLSAGRTGQWTFKTTVTSVCIRHFRDPTIEFRKPSQI